jgi:hypothetical protein
MRGQLREAQRLANMRHQLLRAARAQGSEVPWAHDGGLLHPLPAGGHREIGYFGRSVPARSAAM